MFSDFIYVRVYGSIIIITHITVIFELWSGCTCNQVNMLLENCDTHVKKHKNVF